MKLLRSSAKIALSACVAFFLARQILIVAVNTRIKTSKLFWFIFLKLKYTKR